MNSMIVESDRRYTVIDYADIYEYEYDYSSYTSTLTGYDGEGLITSAIAYVTSDDIPTMYVLEGQDELTLSTTFQDGLSKQNVNPKPQFFWFFILKPPKFTSPLLCVFNNSKSPPSHRPARDIDRGRRLW